PLRCALLVIVAICICGAFWLLLARRPRSTRLPKAPPPPPGAGAPKREQPGAASGSGGETMFQSLQGPGATLEIERSPSLQAGTRADVTVTPFWLGRDSGTKDGLTIPDNGISRLHAYITFENGEYYNNGS